jgi:hypothetical protein
VAIEPKFNGRTSLDGRSLCAQGISLVNRNKNPRIAKSQLEKVLFSYLIRYIFLRSLEVMAMTGGV